MVILIIKLDVMNLFIKLKFDILNCIGEKNLVRRIVICDDVTFIFDVVNVEMLKNYCFIKLYSFFNIVKGQLILTADMVTKSISISRTIIMTIIT